MALLQAFRNSGQAEKSTGHTETRVPDAVIQGGVHRFIKQGFVRLSASQMGVVTRECIHPLQMEVRNLDSHSAQEHIAVLADIMKRDGWLEHDKIDFANYRGRLWLTNGNHRAFAQLKSGKTLDWTIVIHDVSTEEELRALFWKFDTNVRSRTANQLLQAVDFATEHKLPRQVAGAVYRAIPIITHGFDLSKKNRDPLLHRVADRRLAAARAWAKEARLFADCVDGAEVKLKQKLFNAGVAAVALVTLRYQKEKAVPFWQGVAENDGLRKLDPRRALVMDLIARKMNSGLAHQVCAAPALAWNSWFSNNSRSIIKVGDETKIKILGTPFDGSRR